MATITTRTDDITGEILTDETPVTRIFIEGPEHVSAEIDLADTSVKGMLAGEAKFALHKILAKSRPVEPPKPKKLGDDATEAAAARVWAIAERPDLNVKERGAVPKAAIVAYRAHLDNTPEDETPEGQVSE